MCRNWACKILAPNGIWWIIIHMPTFGLFCPYMVLPSNSPFITCCGVHWSEQTAWFTGPNGKTPHCMSFDHDNLTRRPLTVVAENLKNKIFKVIIQCGSSSTHCEIPLRGMPQNLQICFVTLMVTYPTISFPCSLPDWKCQEANNFYQAFR